MKKVLGIVLALAAACAAFAESSTDQVVTFTVPATNEITVSGVPVFTLATPAAGDSAFAPVTYEATYSMFTNSEGMKITAKLDQAMPTGMTLELLMTAPSGATSAGSVVLDATGADLVTGVSNVSAQDVAMTYTLSADATASAVTAATRTVTFTILDGAL